MTKSEKIRFYYGIFLGVMTVLVGVLLIAGAAEIYYSGPDGAGDYYSRAIVGEKLKLLLAPVCVWIAAVVAGFVLSVVYPVRESRGKQNDPRGTVTRLSRRIPAEGEESCMRIYCRAEWSRLILWSVCGAIGLVCAIMCAVYLVHTANFPADDLNPEILKMVANVLPWVAAAFLSCVVATVLDRFLAKKQLPAVRQLVAQGRGKELLPPSALEKRATAVSSALSSKWVLLGVRVAVFCLGVTFFLLGVFNQGARDVLIKAINICTECIGLG